MVVEGRSAVAGLVRRRRGRRGEKSDELFGFAPPYWDDLAAGGLAIREQRAERSEFGQRSGALGDGG